MAASDVGIKAYREIAQDNLTSATASHVSFLPSGRLNHEFDQLFFAVFLDVAEDFVLHFDRELQRDVEGLFDLSQLSVEEVFVQRILNTAGERFDLRAG